MTSFDAPYDARNRFIQLEEGEQFELCDVCHGRGWVLYPTDRHEIIEECPECGNPEDLPCPK